MKKFYLTTPLYYVNDVPHIGHSYTTIAADILARWKRLNGETVHFLTGTDEHGAKIQKASEDAKETPQDFVNRIAEEYKKTWSLLNITYDDFIQTTEPRHKQVVQAIFEKLLATGDIYKGVYEDWYCIHDESYFSEGELVDKKCPSCGREVQKLKEESYFFKLSKFQESLLKYYEAHPEFLSPKYRANEIINFVTSGLNDLSVSRTRVAWGVPVVSNPAHTVYVWFDALINYISAIGYRPDQPFQAETSLWPADVHLVGKEIFRFHTVIWPAMLMALGLPLPKKVFAHGWWTVEGTKMSKSLGNVVKPAAMVEAYGVDAFRYFLFREVPFGSDGDFSEKNLLNRYNVELANNLGNLLQRSLTLVGKHFEGKIPDNPTSTPVLLQDIGPITERVFQAYDQLYLGDVLEITYNLMVRTNKFIDEQAPWKLGAEEKDKIGPILLECLAVLRVLCVFLAPFMPEKMNLIWERLGESTLLTEAAPTLLKDWRSGRVNGFKSGQTTIKADPLFPRIGGRWK